MVAIALACPTLGNFPPAVHPPATSATSWESMVHCVPAVTNVRTYPIARNDRIDRAHPIVPVRVIGLAMATDLESEIAQAVVTVPPSPIVLDLEHVPVSTSVPTPVIDCHRTVARTSTSAM